MPVVIGYSELIIKSHWTLIKALFAFFSPSGVELLTYSYYLTEAISKKYN